MGLGMRNSVDLAVKQANEQNLVPGWTFVLDAEDDQASADAGKNAATKLAADDEVIGVVGPLNSSVGQSVAPIYNSANIVLISPANTNPSLTKGSDLANPKRQWESYFRTCTTDDVQGPFAAKYAFGAGLTSAATIHDKKTYGQGLVEHFTEGFTADGGTITTAETINPDDKDFSAVISKVKATNPKFVYYGGEYPQAGPLSQQMKAAGLNVPLFGGDGIYDPKYISLAGATSTGDLATSVGAPAAQLPGAAAFVDAYKKAGYSEEYGAYGPYAYDAARAIIKAAAESLKNASSPREARTAEIKAVGQVSFDGTTGKVAFDQYGDAKTRILTVYKVENGTWVPEKTDDFQTGSGSSASASSSASPSASAAS
ncbi:branched-chain amino acid transport system substrate-binding protein [Propionibacterium cyclohexanicum]|uniref:Branched-chain amino acid transport system substrate-binding protein n=2 Tax=Propionibacterium cyclohexanicum TaxID=64702 RepID=A0A1H9T483_9ACTN|nr:branched-chain amino acid transport system substrate-binding protein [Propionibacterium cyclohexanicum]